ncbi:MAG TPA: hypothetical protein VF669_17420 [Tepidisphaeraceae bacterium]
MAIPAVMFLFVMWRFIDDEATPIDQSLAQRWFLCTMAYLAIGVPASFFLRSREFKAYWKGKCVSPGHYLRGMLSVWLTMEIGGIAALVGCLVTQSLLPNLLPALVAFMLFIPFWPSGRAMTCPVGDQDDAENYAEPR